MSTNRFFQLIAAGLVCGAFCAVSAMAEVSRPAAYEQLRAVDLSPGLTPKLAHGVSDLSGNERAYGELLPIQLSGPVSRVRQERYIYVKPVKAIKTKKRRAKTIHF